MRRVLPAVAVLVVLAMSPTVELVENALHVVETGHTAHAADGQHDSNPNEGEHGCSGTLHLCSCHAPPRALVPNGVAQPTLASAPSMGAWVLASAHPSPPSAPLLRPPIC